MLHRYWFTFVPSKESLPLLNLGCGVTAFSKAEAIELLQREIFSTYGAREIAEIVEDVDVSTLDEGHILPNIGVPVRRGIWFPQV